ncbi:hypothetical protein HGRIS_014107 [Hohenbuehelia grisea]|uniref:Glycosyl transferase CAP10 domain-containing protein n=1 Tax=Hohenbuehelia grisea TaxID=104357 RepID=A0ABR3JSL7_9AGAR
MTKTFLVLSVLVLASIFLLYRDVLLAYGNSVTQILIIDIPQRILSSHRVDRLEFHSPHEYRPDGFLVVNPDAEHPIPELIARAEARWQMKRSRASKTLRAAVSEYRRRYNRAPPPGFDRWWNYVQDHNVQLPDEYDQIYRDLEPFWGMNPKELQILTAHEEHNVDTYTIGKNSTSKVGIVNKSFSDPENWAEKNLLRGAHDIIELVQDIEHLLPPFRAVVSPLDNPMFVSDHALRSGLVDAASRKKTLSLADYPPLAPPGFLSACPPGSPAFDRPIDLDHPPPASSQAKFIADHRQTMDPCQHPSLFYIHGEFIAHDLGPPPESVMRPRFANCATTVHHDIQIPTLLSWVEDILPRSEDPEWEQKLDDRMTWRGSNTGIWFSNATRWNVTQRVRLVNQANDQSGTVSVLLPPEDESEAVGTGTEMAKGLLNPLMFDIAFAGQPIGCAEETCEQLADLFDWERRQSIAEAGQFKYIFDIDGNAWSSRFKRLITSNSLVFKSTIYPEWFLDRIEPWVHYVPVQMDLSDFYDTFVFFHGGIYGEGEHEDLAMKIASEGRTWSKSFWRKEDMTAYIFRLFLEYSRVMSLDRDDMNFTL